MSKQSQRRALQRGSLNKISSTKVSKHSTGYVFRKGRFADNPSAEETARRERRIRKEEDPAWSLVKGQWVHSSKTGFIKASGSTEGITHDNSEEDRG